MVKNPTNKDSKSILSFIRTLLDGEAVNVNPLKKISKPEITLYGVGRMSDDKYFDTLKERNKAIPKDTILCRYPTIKYFKEFAGQKDVIGFDYGEDGTKYCVVLDSDNIGTYNNGRSKHNGKFIWEAHHGNLRNEFAALKERGILLNPDIYQTEDGEMASMLEECGKTSVGKGSLVKTL